MSSKCRDWFLTVVIGYDTSVISGALVTIGSDLGPEALSNDKKVPAAAQCPASHFPEVSLQGFCQTGPADGSFWELQMSSSSQAPLLRPCATLSGAWFASFAVLLTYPLIIRASDRWPIFNRYRCGSGGVHSTAVYPRTVAHPPPRKNGGPQVRAFLPSMHAQPLNAPLASS